MSDEPERPVDELGLAQRRAWLAVLFLGVAIAWVDRGAQATPDERRRPKGYKGYADTLESRLDELAGQAERWRDRHGELVTKAAGDRRDAAEREHEAQVREQVAICAAIGGPVDPWAAPADAGQNGQPAEQVEHEQRD